MCTQTMLNSYLSSFLQPTLFDDVAYNGIQVDGVKPIRKLATAVTASERAIKQAIEQQCDAILVHHGLFVKNKVSALSGLLYQKVKLLCDSGMALFAYHLPLDAHESVGNCFPLAKLLGWKELFPFGCVGNRTIGVRGRCYFAHPEQLMKQLSAFFGVAGIWVGPCKSISSCAYVSGGGHRFFQEACDQGIDCFITGTHDAEQWHQAYEHHTIFMSFGHFVTEMLGVQLLGKHIEKKFMIEHVHIAEANPF